MQTYADVQVKDARLKARALLDAMKGVAPQWQGVGMVVRSCVLGRTPSSISQLRPQGAASRSGVLNEGDILVSVDGTPVSGMEARYAICVRLLVQKYKY